MAVATCNAVVVLIGVGVVSVHSMSVMEVVIHPTPEAKMEITVMKNSTLALFSLVSFLRGHKMVSRMLHPLYVL